MPRPRLSTMLSRLHSTGMVVVGLALTCAPTASSRPVIGSRSTDQAPPAAIALPVDTVATDVAADGTIRAATTSWSEKRGSASIKRVDPLGVGVAPLALLPDAAGQAAIGAAFTLGGGSVVAYTAGALSRTPKAVAVSVGADGVRGPTETLSAPRKAASTYPVVVVGPTGAVVVPFSEYAGRAAVDRIAFRPAGSAAFAESISLSTQREYSTMGVRVFLGPDGGGVVVGSPTSRKGGKGYLRRLSPTGTLGPRLPLRFPRANASSLVGEFGPGGAFTFALSTLDRSGGATGQLLATTLLPAASRVPALRQIAKSSSSAVRDNNLAVAVDPKGRVVVLAGDDPGAGSSFGSEDASLRIFEGTSAADLTVTTRLRSPYPIDATASFAADGTLNVVWAEGPIDKTSVLGTFGTHRAPGEAFTVPRLLSSPSTATGDVLEGAKQLPDGRLAIQYRRFEGKRDPGRSYLLLATP